MKYMNTLFLAMGLMIVTSAAKADQSATMTCTGSRVVLAVKSPYLGENSKFRQELFVLKSLNNDNETKNTAYFLNVEQDISGANHCFGMGSLIFSGLNEVNGSFELCLHPWKDESNGTTLRQATSGVISYSHGPLKGKNESVSCLME